MRLTEKKYNGHWSLKGVSWDELKPGAVLTEKVWKKLYVAFWRLRDYENTGLSPKEAESLNGIERILTCRAEDREKHRWIPVVEQFPKSGENVLISFANCTLIIVGRYEEDGEGGAFFAGDEDESLISKGLIVNAWMPLPEPYTEDAK